MCTMADWHLHFPDVSWPGTDICAGMEFNDEEGRWTKMDWVGWTVPEEDPDEVERDHDELLRWFGYLPPLPQPHENGDDGDDGDGEAMDEETATAVKAAAEAKRARDEVLARVAQDGLELRNLPEALREDRVVCGRAVDSNGLALEHVCAELRGDRDVVKRACLQNGGALQWASEDLRDDPGIVKIAIESPNGPDGDGWTGGMALEFASARIRADRNAALTAVLRDGNALEFCSHELQGDVTVVLCALGQVAAEPHYAFYQYVIIVEDEDEGKDAYAQVIKFAWPSLQKELYCDGGIHAEPDSTRRDEVSIT